MELLRAFLAAELPSTIQDRIEAATADLHERLGSELIRWVPSRNIHLTLKFLGEVSATNMRLIMDLLTARAAQYDPFEVVVGGFGAYPSARRPRVLWIGLRAPAELAELQRDIEAATARLGYSGEARGFSPHLTIGRVRQNASSVDLQTIRAEIEGIDVANMGTFRVEAIHLFKSDLNPRGSVYTRLHSAPLRNS